MANGALPAIDWRSYLTEEERKKLRRGKVADFFFGGGLAEERKREYVPMAYSRAGEEAIRNIESELGATEGRDLSGMGIQLREEPKTFPELKLEHISKKGYGNIPNVQQYVTEKESQLRAAQESERMGGVQKRADTIAGLIEKDRPVAAESIRTAGGNEDELYKLLKDIIEDIDAKRMHGVTQTGKIELEGEKSKLSEKEAEKQHELDVKLEGVKQAGRIALKELDQLRQSGSGKSEGNKEAAKLMDVHNVFDQLTEEHKSIATGPIVGRVGRLNIYSKNRKKFNATRSFLLKTIARAFEGAKMSDIDMKFYEKMIPSDSFTRGQFEATKESILNLVEWRIQKFTETGEDPGTHPGASSQSVETTGEIPQVKNDEDYDKLPSGTIFIDPDGKQRRKP